MYQTKYCHCGHPIDISRCLSQPLFSTTKGLHERIAVNHCPKCETPLENFGQLLDAEPKATTGASTMQIRLEALAAMARSSSVAAEYLTELAKDQNDEDIARELMHAAKMYKGASRKLKNIAPKPEEIQQPRYYVIITWHDVEPELIGPYDTEDERNQKARELKAEHGDEHGLYWLDSEGQAVAGDFSASDLGIQI